MIPKNEFGDGEDGGDEIDVDFIPSENDICTWTADPEEKRRAFVFNVLANSEHDTKIQLENMQAACDWLKTGRLPGKHLKVVAGNNDKSSTGRNS
jgi:hypothetical protein